MNDLVATKGVLSEELSREQTQDTDYDLDNDSMSTEEEEEIILRLCVSIL